LTLTGDWRINTGISAAALCPGHEDEDDDDDEDMGGLATAAAAAAAAAAATHGTGLD